VLLSCRNRGQKLSLLPLPLLFLLLFWFFLPPASKQSSLSLVVAEQVGGEQLGILGQAALDQHRSPPANPKSASSGRGEGDSLKSRRCLRGCILPKSGCRGEESNPISVAPVYVVYVAAVCGIAPSGTLLFAVQREGSPVRSSRRCSGLLSIVGRKFTCQTSTVSYSGSSRRPFGCKGFA